jgi:hypothetical protein
MSAPKKPAKSVNREPKFSEKRLYTIKEAAVYLGRTEWGIRELIWKQAFPVVKEEGGRKLFIDIVDLENYINSNKSFYR